MEDQHCDRTTGSDVPPAQQTDGVHETGAPTPTPAAAPDGSPTEPATPPTTDAPAPADAPGTVNEAAQAAADEPLEPQAEEPLDPADLAPDADEPGDDLPNDLSGHVHEGDIVPDNVDQREVEPENGQDQA